MFDKTKWAFKPFKQKCWTHSKTSFVAGFIWAERHLNGFPKKKKGFEIYFHFLKLGHMNYYVCLTP